MHFYPFNRGLVVRLRQEILAVGENGALQSYEDHMCIIVINDMTRTQKSFLVVSAGGVCTVVVFDFDGHDTEHKQTCEFVPQLWGQIEECGSHD